ncbi:MAG: TrkA C-terminal domain-containing protein [Hadesarchaea archaeon]|nr:TrkA C-terminal domain-containing protein [Hadesarchaea archaeon]
MQKISYKPKSVRELLTEMKNTSDLMVDLAYTTVLFESKELADIVHRLEARMDELMYTIRIMAAVAARNVKEARKITGILQVASAAEAISNATGDIADLVRRGMRIHPVIHNALRAADEKVVKIKVASGSVLAGKRLHELRLPSTLGVWVLAMKRKKEWTVPPTKETQLLVGDELVARGPWHGVKTLGEMAGTRIDAYTPTKELESICNELAEMRDLSSVMVDLAYSSILLGSREVAEEVREIEEDFDKLNYKLWLDTLTVAARLESDVPRLNSVLQMVKCMEKISDAANSIVDVVLRGVELHPVFAKALGEAEEKISRVEISKRSKMVGKTLGELNLWTIMGIYVLFIKRGRQYIIDPGMDVKIRAGDSAVVRGSLYGVEKFKKEAG